MIDTKIELYKYKPISDGYGGSNLVPVPVKVLVGKFIPKASTKDVTDSKKSFKIEAKFISNKKVEPQDGHLVKCGDVMYAITKITDTPSNRCVLELVANG